MTLFESIKAYEKKLARRFRGVEIQLWPGDLPTDLHLGFLQVRPDNRKAGIGSSVMQALCEHADKYGLRLTLTPAKKNDRMGTTSTNRLIRFYKRFGFVENKGRHSDFTANQQMLRLAQKA